MEASDKIKLFNALLESETIKQLYEDYVIKDIPYRNWVRSMMDYLIELGDK